MPQLRRHSKIGDVTLRIVAVNDGSAPSATLGEVKHVIGTEAELRAIIGVPVELVLAKIADRLNPLTRKFIEGQVPRLAILVEIEEAYTQCSKAFLRSHLWDPARHVDRSTLPSGGEILQCQVGTDFDAADFDAARAQRYARRDGFYRP